MNSPEARFGIRAVRNPGDASRARRRTVLGLILLISAVAHAACSGQARVSPVPRRTLRLTTGTPGAGFHPLGEA